MYLLDTNIVSESRKLKPHGGVTAWLDIQEAATLYVSAMTIGELQRGVELTRSQDANKAAVIEAWLEQVMVSGQVLPMDAAVCREWAKLMHGRSNTLTEDAFIAATAIVHRLTVATRNIRDFKALGVKTINPFEQRR